MIRTPIISFLGHVDSGKTTLQDFIRKTAVVRSEPGEITQSIGASIVPASTIRALCSDLLERLNTELKVPGLLMIDTPGHAAFISLRKRGGTLADLAVLVVNVNEGLMPQGAEAVETLKRFKTPFVIAANKIDCIPGWRSGDRLLLDNMAAQEKNVQQKLEELTYGLAGKLSEFGFDADRYDRVEDYSKRLAIIPCSAKTGEGIPELLVMATGLSQKFLGSNLECSEDSVAKATVLEMKMERGLGPTADVILYDGVLRKGDEIVIGTAGEPVTTKIKALLEPKPLAGMSDSDFRQVEKAVAATGVKIAAPGIENAAAGMPLVGTGQGIEEAKKFVQKEVQDLAIELDPEGIIVKADTFGSLEAMATILKEHGIKIKKAGVGDVTRKDVSDAATGDSLSAVVLGFNVRVLSDTGPGVKIIMGDVIYSLMDDLNVWRKKEKSRLEAGALGKTTLPCKIQLLKGYVFRQSNPAIAGTEILLGTLRTGTSLMKEKSVITTTGEMQLDKENVTEAEKGQQVAVSYRNVVMGRQLNEGDVLYSFINEQEYKSLKELKQYLSQDEKTALREIAVIMRKENPLWGV